MKLSRVLTAFVSGGSRGHWVGGLVVVVVLVGGGGGAIHEAKFSRTANMQRETAGPLK